MAETIKITGLDKLNNLLREGAVEAIKATGGALYREATAMFRVSQEQVPIKYGILKASGQVTLPTYSEHSVEVDIGYGGAASDYALVVHENLEAHHPHGKAKYLEDPVNAGVPGLMERITESVDKAMRSLK